AGLGARTTCVHHPRRTVVDRGRLLPVQAWKYPLWRTIPDGDERAAEVFKTVARRPAVSWVGSTPIRLCLASWPMEPNRAAIRQRTVRPPTALYSSSLTVDDANPDANPAGVAGHSLSRAWIAHPMLGYETNRA